MISMTTDLTTTTYTTSLTAYHRRSTREVKIGSVPLGADNPIRVQSMTTTDTMDTQGTIEQSIRMIDAGCEYVRITAPSVKEAENLKNIKAGLVARGYDTPLVADIHFTPNAAEIAARLIEKVRVNPGNYADKKKFEEIEYTDASYQEELARIRSKFVPLVKICKQHGTAMRIGTNHGSLSDRIMSRYGDTPLGMVESALEFIRICESEGYYDLVVSMKSSNPQVMVQAYRLLVAKLDEEGLQPYPLHLGVTEAGEAEDGRIKSAMGIGTLLEDGLGDTIRVSLTEEPEAEIPVAQMLADRYSQRSSHAAIAAINHYPIDPYNYARRTSQEVFNIGGSNVPRVIADLSQLSIKEMKDLKPIGHHYLPATDKWGLSDNAADFVYSGQNPLPFMLGGGSREIVDANIWQNLKPTEQTNRFPLFVCSDYLTAAKRHAIINFVTASPADLTIPFLEILKADTTAVLLLHTDNKHAMPALRRAFVDLLIADVQTPVAIWRKYSRVTADRFMLDAATDAGGLLIDGLGDGIMLSVNNLSDKNKIETTKLTNETAFHILQAARTRMTKTEYISCPSCGRTLFDLQETTAMIRKRTDHLKGLKIGIMGCIVNGPGEMADADYGYVGSGKGKITLYKSKEVMKRGVPSEHALDELINIIKEDGRWTEPA